MIDNLLRTKLFIPSAHANAIPRPRLVQRLNQGLDLNHRLTLLSAPAGYGKTTLLADWIASKQGSVAWLSLDEQDNSAPRFWLYLIAAFQKMPVVANTTFGQTSVRL